MRTLPLVLAAALAVPAAARAQEEPQRPEPQWSIGAGVSIGLIASRTLVAPLGSVGPYYGVASILPATSVAASIERSLGGRTWLVFGVAGSYEDDKYDVPPTASTATRAQKFSTASVSAGFRRVVTPVQAPVDVSWVLTADAAWARSDATIAVQAAPDASQRYTDTSAGATLGIAVDRTLGAGLSVRVATPLLRGAWSRQTWRSDVVVLPTDLTGKQVGFGLLLQPSLELRLAF